MTEHKLLMTVTAKECRKVITKSQNKRHQDSITELYLLTFLLPIDAVNQSKVETY